MASKAAKTVTVSINNEFIKICEVIYNRKTVQVLNAVSVPIPDNIYDDGELLDIEKISLNIKQTMRDKGFTAKNIIFTLQGSKIATKEVTIPYLKPDKVKSLIHTNATDYFPIDTAQYVFTHSVLEQFVEDGKKKLRVMVIAAPEHMVRNYYDLADRLQLNLLSMDYFGNSILQMIRQQVDEKPNIVVQLNDNATLVNIVKNGVLQLQRVVPYGKNVLLRAIMEEQNKTMEEAERIFNNEKVVHSEFDGDGVTESFRYMVSNLSRIVDYYVTRNQKSPVDKAYLIAAEGKASGLDELLKNELSIPVTVLESLKNVVPSSRLDISKGKLMEYMENLGAVIAPVNFLPRFQIEKSLRKENKKNKAAILLGTVIISAVLIGVPYWNYYLALQDRDRLQASIDQIKEIDEKVRAYYDAKDKAGDVDAFVALTMNNNETLLQVLNNLEEILPSDITLSGLSIGDGTMGFSATASSKVSVAKLLEELGKQNYIYNISISGISETRDDDGNISESFSLTFQFMNIIGEEE